MSDYEKKLVVVSDENGTNTATVTSNGLKVDTGSSSTTPLIVRLEDGTTTQLATVTATGAVKVDGSAVTQPVSFSGNVTVVQPTGTNLHAVIDSGTITANQGGTWTVQQGTPPWSVSQSGTWTVQQGTPPWTVTGTGTAGTPATGVITVQGIAGGTAQPVSGTITANQGGSWTVTANAGTNLNTSLLQLDTTGAKLNLAIASTTSGQTGPLVQGAVTTAAPAYSTGQTDPLSLTTSGALRVDGSAVTQPVSGAVSPLDGAKATYSAAAIFSPTVTTATDIFTITGTASKTVRITKIGFTFSQSTAGEVNVLLIKRSTANSGGTSSAVTAVPHDSNNAAATATALSYTANPTLGTTVGNVRVYKVFAPTVTSSAAPAPPNEYIAIGPSQAIVLRGTSQVLAINMNSVSIVGISADCYFEWTEE